LNQKRGGCRKARCHADGNIAERRSRADREAFRRILNRSGGETPRPDDVLEATEDATD
jgi:hypothetical protein